ncbi:MAG: hypothetical protein KF716_10680 [Anaerolineae bacterium]|nr:hypothetical protein [Anaerolineae bacterium]
MGRRHINRRNFDAVVERCGRLPPNNNIRRNQHRVVGADSPPAVGL